MSDYRQEFLKLAFDTGVLRFGEFTLKSGRVSPYFFNAGLFNTGRSLAQLSRHYASAIVDDGLEFDMLFGPAYKGIPLVAAVSVALAVERGRDLPWCFNRKEAKDHGEGGSLVGAPLKGRVLIVDDVITAGTAVRESLDLIRAAGAEPVGVSIALDRQERGQDSRSAIQSLEQDENLHAVPIARLDDLLVFLEDQPDQAEALESVKAYRDKYGV